MDERAVRPTAANEPARLDKALSHLCVLDVHLVCMTVRE